MITLTWTPVGRWLSTWPLCSADLSLGASHPRLTGGAHLMSSDV
jgi:hypothetical protein